MGARASAASAVTALLLLPSAAAADGSRFEPVGVPARDLGDATGATAMTAAAGHVVFSRAVGARAYELVDWSAGGGFRTITMAGRRTAPFDADAGSNAEGRPVLTYSVCAAPRRCSLRTLRLDRPGSRPVRLRLRGDRGLSLTNPSRHGSGVAAAAAPARGQANTRILFWRTREAEPRRLSGGTAKCPSYATCPKEPPTLVDRLDLGRRSVAFVWDFVVGYSGIADTYEVRSAPLTGARSRQAAAAYGYFSGTCGFRRPDSPSALPDGGLGFVLHQSPCEDEQTAIARLAPGADDFEGARPTNALIGGAAWDGNRVFWLRCVPIRDENGAEIRSPDCRLVVSAAVPFGPPKRGSEG